MKRTALALSLVLAAAGSGCALHPVAADPGYDPYYTGGGEHPAYAYERRRAWEQQRAYEQQHAYEHAARDAYARRRAWEHQRRDRDRWQHERAVRAAHERAAWDRHPRRDRSVHVTGHGPVGGRVAPAPAPSREVVRPAPRVQVEHQRAAPVRVAPAQPSGRAVQIHRAVGRPD